MISASIGDMKGSGDRSSRSKRVRVQKRDKDFAYFQDDVESENSPIKSNDPAGSPNKQSRIRTRTASKSDKHGAVSSPKAKKVVSSRNERSKRGSAVVPRIGETKAEAMYSPRGIGRNGSLKAEADWSISPNHSDSERAFSEPSTISEFLEKVFERYYRDVSTKEICSLLGFRPEAGQVVVKPVPELEDYKASDFEVVRLECDDLPVTALDIFDYCKGKLGLVESSVELQMSTQAHFNALFAKKRSTQLYKKFGEGQLKALSLVDSAQNGKVIGFVIWNVLVCPVSKSSNETVKLLHIPLVWLDSCLSSSWPFTLLLTMCVFGTLSAEDNVKCAFASISTAHLSAIQTITKCYTVRCRSASKDHQMITVLDPLGLAVAYEEIFATQFQGIKLQCQVEDSTEHAPGKT